MQSDHRFSNSNMFIISEDQAFLELVRLYLVNNGFRNLYVFNNLLDAAETLSLFPAKLLITSVDSSQFQKHCVTKISNKHPRVTQTPVIAVDLQKDRQPPSPSFQDEDYPIRVRVTNRQNLIETIQELLAKKASVSRKHHMQKPNSKKRSHAIFAAKEKSLRRAFDRSC